LGLLDRFRRKKKVENVNIETKKIVTDLEQFCGDDKETYEALYGAMFLDPRKTEISIKEAAENAKKAEKEKDFIKARAWYEIAGSLAVYEGNVKKVVEYFSECERIAPSITYPILKNPEKAVEKAQEFYKKYLKA
jgi:hypothetical protein